MSTTDFITELDTLPAVEQEKVFAFLAQKIITKRDPEAKPWLGKKLSFDEACEVVFRENRELLSLLAK